MALKSKKPLFYEEPEPDKAAEEEKAEAPYKVFKTKEEYDSEIAAAAQARQQPPREEGEEQRRQRRIALWQRDAEMLGIVVPDFDFEAALENDTFRGVLARGGNIFEAYAAALRPARTKRSEIFQNAQNNLRGTGDAEINPAKLSSEEFGRYIDNIRNS